MGKSLWIYTTLSVLATAVVLGAGWNNSDNLVPFIAYIINSKFNVLVLLNLAFNLLFLFGKLLQFIFFGNLRDSESRKIYDRLLQYILFKIVFVGAVIEPAFKDLIVWTIWFSILAFMRIFSLLTRDRFEHITTFNPNASRLIHGKLITLLISILLADAGWFCFCITVFSKTGSSMLLLLTFECFTLFLDTIQTLIKYIIHLIDISRQGVWEPRGTYIYYTEFVTDILVLFTTLCHYLHILFIHGISLNLIDAVLFLHMRMVYNNLKEKIAAYRNYRRLAQDMKDRYPEVSTEELQALDDICPICHEKLERAKKLPCGHIFHHSCLRSWLENHHNCPTCRYSLIETSAGPAGPARVPRDREHREEIFRFNGPRWFSWLPTIQVVSERRFMPLENEQASQAAIRRVQEIFPNISAQTIALDLQQTHSVEQTIENLLQREPQDEEQNSDHQIGESNQEITRDYTSQSSSLALRSEVSTPPVNIENNNNVSTELPILSDTFGNTAEERQESLRRRKQALYDHAKRAFDLKQQQSQPQQQLDESLRTEERRKLFLAAAERRQANKNQ